MKNEKKVNKWERVIDIARFLESNARKIAIASKLEDEVLVKKLILESWDGLEHIAENIVKG